MLNILIGDGGMGTELRFRGVNVPSHIESIWSALALTTDTKTITKWNYYLFSFFIIFDMFIKVSDNILALARTDFI